MLNRLKVYKYGETENNTTSYKKHKKEIPT